MRWRAGRVTKKCREVGNEFGVRVLLCTKIADSHQSSLLLSWAILLTVSLSQCLFRYLLLILSISLDRNQQKEVNDELLKRITDNKAQPPARNFRVERSTTSIPISLDSQTFEVHAWLNAKGFSRPWVTHELWHVTLSLIYMGGVTKCLNIWAISWGYKFKPHRRWTMYPWERYLPPGCSRGTMIKMYCKHT